MSKDEKLLILKMVEEGKISSSEAAKLLEAIEGSENNHSHHQGKNNFRSGQGKKESFSSIERDFEDLGEEIGDKISAIAEKMGDMGEKIASSIEDKIESMDKSKTTRSTQRGTSLLDKLLDKLDFSWIGDNYHTTKKNYTFPLSNLEEAYIYIQGINGKIEMTGYDGSEVVLDVVIKSKHPLENDIMDIQSESSKLIVKHCANTRDLSVSYYVKVPRKLIKEILLQTTNGKISAQEIQCLSGQFISSNGKVELMQSKVDKLEALTSNGKIALVDSHCTLARAKTSNGKVEMINSPISDLKIKTSNGSININNFNIKGDSVVHLATSNGRIYFEGGANNIAYDIEAYTSHGSVNINLPNIVYSNGIKPKLSSRNIKAVSDNFNVAPNRATIIAETSNSSITIQ